MFVAPGLGGRFFVFGQKILSPGQHANFAYGEPIYKIIIDKFNTKEYNVFIKCIRGVILMADNRYRLNVKITQESAEVLKTIAEEYGTTMGTAITILTKEWLLKKKAVEMGELYKQIKEDEKNNKYDEMLEEK